MVKLKMILCGSMLVAVMALTGLNAQAIPTVDMDSYDDVLTELAGEPLRVDLFNPALGILNSVEVTLEGYLRSGGQVTNNAAGPEDFTVSTRAQLYEGVLAAGSPMALPGTFPIFNPFDLIEQEAYMALPAGVPTAFGPDQTDKGPLTVLSTTNAVDLAQFVGVGQFGYDFTTEILTTILGGGGNIDTSIDTIAGAKLTVTYDYDVPSVPEPALTGLFGLGLVGLGFARRRVRKKT
jgi:hypothetical protein